MHLIRFYFIVIVGLVVIHPPVTLTHEHLKVEVSVVAQQQLQQMRPTVTENYVREEGLTLELLQHHQALPKPKILGGQSVKVGPQSYT